MGTFFSAVSTTAGAGVVVGGWRVQAEGGLRRHRDKAGILDQDAMTVGTNAATAPLKRGFAPGSGTHSGCVLAVGLSMETVRILLLLGDGRHLQTVCVV